MLSWNISGRNTLKFNRTNNDENTHFDSTLHSILLVMLFRVRSALSLQVVKHLKTATYRKKNTGVYKSLTNNVLRWYRQYYFRIVNTLWILISYRRSSYVCCTIIPLDKHPNIFCRRHALYGGAITRWALGRVLISIGTTLGKLRKHYSAWSQTIALMTPTGSSDRGVKSPIVLYERGAAWILKDSLNVATYAQTLKYTLSKINKKEQRLYPWATALCK